MDEKIKLRNEFRFFLLLVSNISYARGDKHECNIICKDGFIYHCPMSIREIVDTFTHYGLYLISESLMINIHRISIHDIFNFQNVMMDDGCILKVSYRQERILRALKLNRWTDLNSICLELEGN